jgi:hypothetical protein
MSDKPQKEVVILQESVVASLIKDAGTFVLFGGLMYFNHRVLAGNGWIDFIFILIVFMWLASRNMSQVFTGKRADAIKWLQDKEQK